MANQECRTSEQDLRQLGAMVLFLREDGMVWIMDDESKREESAGTKHGNFQREIVCRKNVPAGGRNGYETPQKTLIEETFEEAHIKLPEETVFTKLHP